MYNLGVPFRPLDAHMVQLRRFWRGVQVITGRTSMARRRLMRALMQQRMERAAALIAGKCATGSVRADWAGLPEEF